MAGYVVLRLGKSTVAQDGGESSLYEACRTNGGGYIVFLLPQKAAIIRDILCGGLSFSKRIVFKKCCKFAGRKRLAEQVTLGLIAVEGV